MPGQGRVYRPMRAQGELRGLSPFERQTLAQAPRRAAPSESGANIPGKIWAVSPTLLRLRVGAAGYVAGQVQRRLGLTEKPAPGVRFANNAIAFVNNPMAPGGAVTLGNVTIYPYDPYDPKSEEAAKFKARYGYTVQEHERAHTRQAEQLGPLYLPSNIAGGLTGLIRDRDWHGPSNWNERGPLQPVPRPWPSRPAR